MLKRYSILCKLTEMLRFAIKEMTVSFTRRLECLHSFESIMPPICILAHLMIFTLS